MTGPRQHYIPQSFLRPFKMEHEDKNKHVWQYRKELPLPTSVSIKDIAVQKYFYSEKPTTDEATLDKVISDYEQSLAPLLKQLIESKKEDIVPAEIAAEVIAHLTTRAKTIRHMMNDGLVGLIERLSSLLDKGFDVKYFPASAAPSGLETLLLKLLKERTETGEIDLLDETLSKVAYAYARENADTLLKQAKQYRENILNLAKAIDLRDAHAKSFKEMAPKKITEKLSKLSWIIHEISDDFAILPDCIGIASENGIDFQSIIGGTKDANLIIVPITPDKLLVGTKNIELKLSVDQFNELAASCSTELFIANNDGEKLKNLHKKIGKSLQSLLTDATNEAINEIMIEYTAPESSIILEQVNTTDNFNLAVRFPKQIVELYEKAQLEAFAKDIVSEFTTDSLSQLTALHFDDQSEAVSEYANSNVNGTLQIGSQRMRADGICAVIPSKTEYGKYELHINQQVLDLFMNPDERKNSIDYINKSESDLSLIPILDSFDASEFSKVEEIFVINAIRSMRAYLRIQSTKNNSLELSKAAKEIASELMKIWNEEALRKIRDSTSSMAEMVSEILERMSYSMLLLATFSAHAGKNLKAMAYEICDSPEFIRWILLFDEDMRLAMKWLQEDRRSDAILIPAAHLERLMFGIGIFYELDENSNTRYEIREGYVENSLPLPFRSIIENN